MSRRRAEGSREGRQRGRGGRAVAAAATTHPGPKTCGAALTRLAPSASILGLLINPASVPATLRCAPTLPSNANLTGVQHVRVLPPQAYKLPGGSPSFAFKLEGSTIARNQLTLFGALAAQARCWEWAAIPPVAGTSTALCAYGRSGGRSAGVRTCADRRKPPKCRAHLLQGTMAVSLDAVGSKVLDNQ